MAQVAAFELVMRLPGRFLGTDMVGGAAHFYFPADVVEHEEFVFRAEVGGVTHAGGGEIGLSALGDRAGIPVVRLHGGGLDDVATQVQRGVVAERVDDGRVVIGHQNHVGLVDRLPTGDGGAVEHEAVSESVGIDPCGRHSGVLLFAFRVGESEIDPLNVVFLDEFECVFRHCCPAPFVYRSLVVNRSLARKWCAIRESASLTAVQVDA